MKTTMKLFAIISLALIALGAGATNPSKGNSNKAGQIVAGNIKYTVTIHVNPEVIIPKLHFYLVITDENNRRITSPQQVEPGKWTYQFSEIGPVSGTRIAKLVQGNADDAFMPYSCNPDAKWGTFKNGVTYMFNLYPTHEIPQ